MTVSAVSSRARYAAPQQDGAALLEPPLDALHSLVAHNRSLALPIDERLDGITASELREMARRELVTSARQYTGEYRQVPDTVDANQPLILSGHQPELIHCGVWFKHFLLDEAARRIGGIGIHVSIDHDTAKRTSVLVPSGTVDSPRLLNLPYDDRTPSIPYEDRPIRNVAAFESFGDRVTEALRDLVPRPLIRSYWPRVVHQKHRPLGEAVAIGRHQVEAEIGLETLEVPLSRVCQGTAFHWFLSLVMGDMARLRASYNTALADYRAMHGLRSRQHPVPDLSHEDSWYELPLWIWHRSQPIRRRCYIRRRGNEVTLSDLADLNVTLVQPEGRADAESVSALLDLRDQGIRLRPRALTTTLFARWLVGDVFIHGIGGAVYDAVTNEIVRRWWNSPVPEFIVASATYRLPVAPPAAEPADLRRLDEQLRQLEFHPELFIDAPPPEAQRWIEQKRYWLQRQLPKGERKERHDRITEANARLQEWVRPLKFKLASERARVVAELRRYRILHSREFAFCLFPQEHPARIRQTLQEMG